MAALQPTEVIVIGGSAGALDALDKILPALPPDMSLPLVVVLHLPPHKPSVLASVLRARCALPVREPDDKEPIAPGTLYVAAPNYHLLTERTRTFSLSLDDLVLFSRPSIDVLFESAAAAYGPGAAGLLLSGANEDGARGLARIHEAGGLVIIQAPEDAPVATMPEAGLRLVEADYVLPAGEIGSLLSRLGSSSARKEAR